MSDGESMAPSRLGDLIALAKEPSSEKRRLLLRELTDQFFGAPEQSAVENELYGAVLERLAEDMEEAVRVELSQRFAQSMSGPARLVRRLALDECASVASPVLERSRVLDDAVLMEVARTRSQEHLRAVSRREQVSQGVSDLIVERGDDETLGTLLGNEGAELSRGAHEQVVERASANPRLHEAVIARKSMPPDLLNEMYFVVEARLRQKILERNAALDPGLLEAALAAGRGRLASEDDSYPPDYEEALLYVRELHAASQLTPQVLARFLRSNGRTHFLIALALLADIDFHTARKIVSTTQIDALAVVCKAAGLDRALFLTYAVVLLNHTGDAMGHARTYAQLYNDLTPETAHRTLRFWRMRREARAA